MAQLVDGAIHKGWQNEPYWKPFFDSFPPIHQWLGQVKPDVVVVFFNDHRLNFFLDKMPTFLLLYFAARAPITSGTEAPLAHHWWHSLVIALTVTGWACRAK